MDIVEVAKRSGVPASALRYYEEKGLIASVGRSGLRRVFDAGVMERLALIALARAAGFSLDETAGMFGTDGRLRIDRAVLSAKADDVEALAKRLRRLANGLRHAAACRAENHLACPTFRGLMRAAAAGQLPPVAEGRPLRVARPRRKAA